MKRVLIVDDSPMVHHLLKKVLEANNFEVCGIAKNGRDGVQLFGKLNPDIVFMDVTMPVMDGVEATKRIKGANRDTKVIMLTAMGDKAMAAEARAVGVDLILKKPFNEMSIARALLNVSRRRNPDG